MDVRIGELASTGSTSDTLITITDLPSHSPTHVIQVVSGTLKVGRLSTPTTAHPFAAGDKILISLFPGELCVKQGGASDTWVITA